MSPRPRFLVLLCSWNAPVKRDTFSVALPPDLYGVDVPAMLLELHERGIHAVCRRIQPDAIS
jgi:hypothetical protein